MLNELLNKALTKKMKIISKLSNVKVEKPISLHQFKEQEFRKIAGIDGSMNLIEYKKFIIYGISSVSVLSDEQGVRVAKSMADVDIILPYWLPKERVKLYMSILELKNALYVLRNYSDYYVILDGSIINMIIKPFRYSVYQALLYDNEYILKVIEECLNNLEEIYSRQISEQLINKWDTIKEEDYNIFLALEYSEYLTLLKEILSKYKDRVLSIAKRSESNILFKKSIPDAALLESLTQKPGFIIVNSNSHKISYNAKWRTLLYWEFFKSLPMTISLGRLSLNGPILKMEVPLDASLDQISFYWSVLHRHSVNGYPYPLRLAHNISKIKKRDIRTIAKVLGLYWEKTGREFL